MNGTTGIAYTYDDKFNICLAINCTIKDKFLIHKTIQHELIHWMQSTLNADNKHNYGLFPGKKLKLSPFDKITLLNLGVNEKYLLDEYEFEPCVANTVEEFYNSGLSLDEFIENIKNNYKFIDTINSNKLYNR